MYPALDPWAFFRYFLLLSFAGRVLTAPSALTKSTEDGPSIDNVQDGLKCQTKTLEPYFDKSFESRRVQVSYPLISVPPMTVNDGMATFGELSTYLPCHECLVLSMEADVAYQDGTRASPASSFWLHHAVFVNRGRMDHFCGPKSWGQRFFAVGNERTLVNMSALSTRIGGYHIRASDEVAISIDLMNMSLEPQEVIFTVTYEFVEEIPTEFTSVEPIWLDIGGCGTSSAPAQSDSAFDFTSPVWSSSLSGEATFIGAHLHDGGVCLQILKNDKAICEAQPTYSAYLSHLEEKIEEHISSISTCVDAGKIEMNDELKIKAFYNTSLHKPMLNMDGSLEPVMGIALLYVGMDREKDTTGKRRGWCPWLETQDFVLLIFCSSLGTLLALAWVRQKRSNQLLQPSSERTEKSAQVGRDIKIPLLSHRWE